MKEGWKKQEKKMAATKEGDRGKRRRRKRKEKEEMFLRSATCSGTDFAPLPVPERIQGRDTASLDFDFVQLELESKELSECGRKRREADDLGDVVQVWVGTQTRYLERTLKFLQ